MSLSRDQILGAQDLVRSTVQVPEWGGSVEIRALSGTERDALEADFQGDKKRAHVNIRARLAALSICDESGNRLFTDRDIEKLGAKSSLALDRVFEAAMNLNRLSPQEVEKLAGESASGQS